MLIDESYNFNLKDKYGLMIAKNQFGYTLELFFGANGTNYVIDKLKIDKKYFLDSVIKYNGRNNVTFEYPNISFKTFADIKIFVDDFIISYIFMNKFL